ncbi:MAG: hypothetical protein JWN95_1650 [Frankiales bacterium]|nr:hypothetical protein [Frankiales bacterium]
MTAIRTPLLERIHRFADELRTRGLPISMVERIDAMRAVETVGLNVPNGLHLALSATLVKAAEHRGVFDEVFQLYFRSEAGAGVTWSDLDDDDAEDADGTGAAGTVGAFGLAPDQTPLDLDHALRTALRDGSEVLARLIAEQAVLQFSRFEPGRPVAGVLYESRTIEGLRLEQVRAEIAREVTEGSGGASGNGAAGGAGGGGSGSELGLQLRRQEVADRANSLRQQIREVIREQLVADRGLDAVTETLRTPLPADADISMANRDQLAEIERAMKPLERKLATTMMRKRRQRNGQLDVRATLRASMATGGVPVKVLHRRPNPTKPQLYVLADMSGSVATFAAFTVTLVSALTQLFSRLRTFAFIENAIELTDLFRENEDPLQTIRAINRLGGPSYLGGHTDYGHALRQFGAEISSELGRRSTVLIFGDGRGNYLPSEEATLVDISRRAGAVYWLNPEARPLWGTGDSLMHVYARHCTEAVSCRTLNDLRRFIEDLD